MDKSFLDIVFILRQIKDSEATVFQKDCILSSIEHHFTTYMDEQVKDFLLKEFDKKFDVIRYEA